MRWIPTRVHGIMDYLSAATLLALPHLLNASDRATTLFTVVGLSALVYSLLTRFELGLFKVLPMTVHLVLDFLSGALLLAAPFFMFPTENQSVRIAMMVMGVLEIGAALMTRTHSSTEQSTRVRTDVSGLSRPGSHSFSDETARYGARDCQQWGRHLKDDVSCCTAQRTKT